jgi:AraC-like DNA-binding protein
VDPLPEPPVRGPGESLVAFERRQFQRRVVWHTHADAEVTLVLDGNGTRLVGDSVERYERGDLCVIAGGTPHVWQAETPVQALVVRFSGDLLSDRSLPELRGVRAVIDRARTGLAIEGPTRDAVTQEVTSLFAEPSGSWRRPLRLLEALSVVSAGEARALAGRAYQPHAERAADERLSRALAYVEASLGDRVSHAEAAARTGLTAAAFSRFFRRKTGRTFEDYVNDARVARACRALLESDRSITDIAYDVGFGSLAHFHRTFRRVKGTTPTEYRQLGAVP